MYYYVNKNSQLNWDHEVHTSSCSWLPNSENRLYLWNFESCWPAKTEAKKYYASSDWCFYCCNPCHKS